MKLYLVGPGEWMELIWAESRSKAKVACWREFGDFMDWNEIFYYRVYRKGLAQFDHMYPDGLPTDEQLRAAGPYRCNEECY